MRTWVELYLVEPARDLLSSTALGDEVTDLGRCQKLCTGIEGVFRSEVQGYAGWPPESTTDGLVPGLCVRTGDNTIELVAMCWIDFGGEKFPLRAVVTLDASRAELAMYTAEIGEVEPDTGAPPRLHRDAMILPSRDINGRNPKPELLVGHRSGPITWQAVVEYIPGAAEE